MSDAPIMLYDLLVRNIVHLRQVPKFIARWIDFQRRGVYVAAGTVVQSGVSIGRRTRINAPSHLGGCDIGSYCAIGGRLIVRATNHDYRYLNMQYFAQKKYLDSEILPKAASKGTVTVGHGVWIGDSVIILPGITVGNGAVIGAGSIVSKNVADYAIAVGNPARTIKYRFSASICEALKHVRWWEWSDQKISENLWLFEQELTGINETALLTKLKNLENNLSCDSG